jgi:integrase
VRAFSDHAAALRYAERIGLEIVAAGADARELVPGDRIAYSLALSECVKRGISFADMVAEWSQARKSADMVGRSLGDIVAAGVLVLTAKTQTVESVVQEMLASKSGHDLQRRYLRGLRATGELLAARFPGPIQHVTAADLERLLDTYRGRGGQPVGPRRRNNLLREVRQVFAFAQSRGYLRADVPNEAKKVSPIRRVRPRIGILAPEVLRLYLQHCSEEFLPWLALNAFSGVRPEEIVLSKDAPRGKDALRWSDFDWHEREIRVRPETAKTGQPRPCPISDNLAAWLEPWRNASGPVLPARNGRVPRIDHERARFILAAAETAKEMAAAARLAGELGIVLDVSYPPNALRHSYCSYRIALTKDVAQVAYEAGDSVEMQKRHYNNPRPVSQARAWFAIFPNIRPENVVRLSA